MALPQRLTLALESLTGAVDRLEKAAARRTETARADPDGPVDPAALGRDNDRLRAAHERDQIRLGALMQATAGVEGRLARLALALRAMDEREAGRPHVHSRPD